MSFIAENFDRVFQQVVQAAKRSGRCPEDVQLVVVTKYLDVEQMEPLVNLGIVTVGENWFRVHD